MNAPSSLWERPEAKNLKMQEIFRQVRSGRISIPQFQRDFVWKFKDTKLLFDSIYRGYPIGALLFLLRKHSLPGQTRSSFGPVTMPQASSDLWLVIDGQQRLTSLVGVCLLSRTQFEDPEVDSRWKLCFDLQKLEFVQSRSSFALPPHHLPLWVLGDTVLFLEWTQQLPRNSESVDLIRAANEFLRTMLDYDIPFYLVRSEDEKQIREIFRRMNETGHPLSAADVFNAIHGQSEGGDQFDLRSLKEQLKKQILGDIKDRMLLQGLRVVLGVDPLGSMELITERVDIHEKMNELLTVLNAVGAFLRDDCGIPHLRMLPYQYTLLILISFFHAHPCSSQEDRQSLRMWLWRVMCTARFENSPNSRMRELLAPIKVDAKRTVQGLLELTHEAKPLDGLETFNYVSAKTKLMANYMISLCPRDLESGAPLDIVDGLEEHDSELFQPLLQTRDFDETDEEGLRSSPANRLVQPPLTHGRLVRVLESVRDKDAPTRSSILASHAISDDAWQALLNQEYGLFILFRKETLEEGLKEFLHRNAGF